MSGSSSSTGATSSASPSISISTSPADSGHRPADDRIGEISLSAAEIAARVQELGAEIAHDYAGREPVLVASLKASLVFVADLSRAMPILHALDFVELAGYGSASMGGHQQIRVLKDLDLDVRGRDVLVVEDVVDTGLTLNYLVRTLDLRGPSSVAAVTLLDRPFRRLVDDLPVRYVGFAVPDELYVGYGFDLEERYRELPDLRLLHLG
ncbi:MAG: hypoxanthine phosphoribosyltransferase [Actinobacteria bacterium]|nr:MAG: hypoxanthine phosphoribosyltransferase [Actinomycetota bacterium]